MLKKQEDHDKIKEENAGLNSKVDGIEKDLKKIQAMNMSL